MPGRRAPGRRRHRQDSPHAGGIGSRSRRRISTPPQIAAPVMCSGGAPNGGGVVGGPDRSANPPIAPRPSHRTSTSGPTMITIPPMIAKARMVVPCGSRRAYRRSSSAPPMNDRAVCSGPGAHRPRRTVARRRLNDDVDDSAPVAGGGPCSSGPLTVVTIGRVSRAREGKAQGPRTGRRRSSPTVPAEGLEVVEVASVLGPSGWLAGGEEPR